MNANDDQPTAIAIWAKTLLSGGEGGGGGPGSDGEKGVLSHTLQQNNNKGVGERMRK